MFEKECKKERKKEKKVFKNSDLELEDAFESNSPWNNLSQKSRQDSTKKIIS